MALMTCRDVHKYTKEWHDVEIPDSLRAALARANIPFDVPFNAEFLCSFIQRKVSDDMEYSLQITDSGVCFTIHYFDRRAQGPVSEVAGSNVSSAGAAGTRLYYFVKLWEVCLR